MSDFQSAVQRMLDQIDPPVLKAMREANEKMDRWRSPEFERILESHRTLSALVNPPGMEAFREAHEKMNRWRSPELERILKNQGTLANLINRPEFVKAAQLFKFHGSSLPGEMNKLWEISTVTTSYDRTLQLLMRLDLKAYDFQAAEDDDLELTSYEMLPDSDLAVPENKIVLLNEVSNIQKIIAAIYKDNSQLYHIHHREFEEMMAELLKSRDFEVFLTKKTRDGGTDIIALQNLAGMPIKMLVECKKNAPTRKIGVDVIRGFSHVVNTTQANKGIIFTTSYFTADAKKEQQQYMPYLLDLKDYQDVIGWVNAYVE